MPPITQQPWQYDAQNQRYNWNPNQSTIDYDPATGQWNETGQQSTVNDYTNYLQGLGAAPADQQEMQFAPQQQPGPGVAPQADPTGGKRPWVASGGVAPPQQQPAAPQQPMQQPGSAPAQQQQPRPSTLGARPQTVAGEGATMSPYGTFDMFDSAGDTWGPSGIPEIQLNAPEQLSGAINGNTASEYNDYMNNLAGQSEQQYAKQPMPEFDPAQMGLGGVPQPGANQMGQSAELSQQLSGQGFSPAVQAQMKARASEGVSAAGRTQLSQAKIALGQAGLSGSPAGAAISSDIARQSGNERTSALRDIDIANAQQGNQNQQFGIGQQSQIGLSNMQQANQMATDSANRMFAAMNQNLANQQQSNMAQFGAGVERQNLGANASANVLAQQGGALQGARLGREASAEEGNVANQNNFQLNQAQLNRQQAMENQRAGENRWNTASNLASGFAGNPGYQPGQQTSFIGSALGQTGSGILGNTLGNINWGTGNNPNDRQQGQR